MSIHTTEGDFAENLLERRWFASMAAARAKEAECHALLEVMAMVKASWMDSHVELAKLEALRDALADAVSGATAEQSALRAIFAEGARRASSAA